MTASRDLQLCPECIQLYLISTFKITFYHYLDNFSSEEGALFRDSMLMSSIRTSDTVKQDIPYGEKNCIKYTLNIIGLFPQYYLTVTQSEAEEDRLSPGETPAAVAELGPQGAPMVLVHQELPLLCHLAVAPVSRKLKRKTDY